MPLVFHSHKFGCWNQQRKSLFSFTHSSFFIFFNSSFKNRNSKIDRIRVKHALWNRIRVKHDLWNISPAASQRKYLYNFPSSWASNFATANRFRVTWSGSFVWERSPKSIDREGLGISRTGTRQIYN